MWEYLSCPPRAERMAHPQHCPDIQQPSQCIQNCPKWNVKRPYMHTNITSNAAPLAAVKMWTKCIMWRIWKLQLICLEINLYVAEPPATRHAARETNTVWHLPSLAPCDFFPNNCFTIITLSGIVRFNWLRQSIRIVMKTYSFERS